jgi:hypothetical protein
MLYIFVVGGAVVAETVHWSGWDRQFQVRRFKYFWDKQLVTTLGTSYESKTDTAINILPVIYIVAYVSILQPPIIHLDNEFQR